MTDFHLVCNQSRQRIGGTWIVLIILNHIISKLICSHILRMFILHKFVIFNNILVKTICSNDDIISHERIEIKVYDQLLLKVLLTFESSKFRVWTHLEFINSMA